MVSESIMDATDDKTEEVLILVLMADGLWEYKEEVQARMWAVLILVLMADGLWASTEPKTGNE